MVIWTVWEVSEVRDSGFWIRGSGFGIRDSESGSESWIHDSASGSGFAIDSPSDRCVSMERRKRSCQGVWAVQRSVGRADDARRFLAEPDPVWYARFSSTSGNNSVVECDLAKVE